MKNNLISKQLPRLLSLLLIILFPIVGCSSEQSEKEIPSDWISGITSLPNVAVEGSTQSISIKLVGGITPAQVQCTVAEEGKDWCQAKLEGTTLTIVVYRSYQVAVRTTTVLLTYDENHICRIPVTQEAATSQEDVKIKVLSGTATSEWGEEVNHLTKSYDGDYSTYYNSKVGAITTWPFLVEYTLESGHTLNSIVYTPRTDAGNKWGSFNKFDVMVSTESNPDTFTKVGSYERGNGNHSAFTIKLETPIHQARTVRFVLHATYENRASCAEMEFFEESKNKFDHTTIFADKLCTQLKEGVTEMTIKQIPHETLKELALALLHKTYNTHYRVAEYRPYQHPSVMAAANKTSKYSLRDNPTGIYADAGDELTVVLESAYAGANIALLVQDLNGGYNKNKTYALEKGLNHITLEHGGLIYLLNHVQENLPLLLKNTEDQQAAAAKTVKVHIALGKVNGYFDSQKNNADDWNQILNKAKYQDIDAVGKYAHITWKTADFKKFNTDILLELEKYDRLVYLQEEFMGLVKYQKMFNNRMHFSIDYTAKSPNSSDYRTVYTPGYAEVLCNPDRFGARLWGPAHEVGHSNQTRPGLNWAGLTEVTNNIMSMYTQQQFGEPSKLLVDGHTVNGGFSNFYTWAAEYIINDQRPHCLPGVENIQRELQLVPFWQLKLYLIDALEQKDFYHDLYEHYRITPNLNTQETTQGILQLDFVRQVCRLSGFNLIDFFTKWGFLRPVDTTLNDYSQKKFCITQTQINALIKEIEGKNYPMPHVDLEKITEENLSEYTSK